MKTKAGMLEKEAHELLAKGCGGEAFELYGKAADAYGKAGAHKEAAMCLASAASSWAAKSGERMFHNSSLSYEAAGREAEKAGDLEYASVLYRQAAINFERDQEFFSFSECFYRSRECLRRFLTLSLVTPRALGNLDAAGIKRGESYSLMKRLAMCFSLTFSALLWGHGEKPARTFFALLFVVFASALIYTQCYFTGNGALFRPGIFESLYFSVVTVTTVGYGDMAPAGWARLVAMAEVLCGIFIVPVFIVGLSRKFLRT